MLVNENPIQDQPGGSECEPGQAICKWTRLQVSPSHHQCQWYTGTCSVSFHLITVLFTPQELKILKSNVDVKAHKAFHLKLCSLILTPQELKILKSKVDVEAEQNASSFTSTVSTEPYIMAIWQTFLSQVKVEKKKTSVKAEVQTGAGKQQATKAHPLMSSASLGAMPQRWEHLHVYCLSVGLKLLCFTEWREMRWIERVQGSGKFVHRQNITEVPLKKPHG